MSICIYGAYEQLIEHLWSDDGRTHIHSPIPLIDSAHPVGWAEWKRWKVVLFLERLCEECETTCQVETWSWWWTPVMPTLPRLPTQNLVLWWKMSRVNSHRMVNMSTGELLSRSAFKSPKPWDVRWTVGNTLATAGFFLSIFHCQCILIP